MEAYQEIREKFPDADSVMYGRGLIARPYLLDAIMQKEDGEDHRKNTGKSCGSSMTVFTGIIRNIFQENEMYFSA